jgi:hypothetical protein
VIESWAGRSGDRGRGRAPTRARRSRLRHRCRRLCDRAGGRAGAAEAAPLAPSRGPGTAAARPAARSRAGGRPARVVTGGCAARPSAALAACPVAAGPVAAGALGWGGAGPLGVAAARAGRAALTVRAPARCPDLAVSAVLASPVRPLSAPGPAVLAAAGTVVVGSRGLGAAGRGRSRGHGAQEDRARHGGEDSQPARAPGAARCPFLAWTSDAGDLGW